jgi:glycosyltransferase involved in cell wall biosynthesis
MAWQLYQRRDLQSAQILHATSSAEIQDFRAAGFTQPIAMISNGVEIPLEIQNPKFKIQNSEKRTALFLSRIHPKKGLLNLVNAWSLVRPKEWRMIIAGPDESGHLAQVQKLVREKNMEKDFEFRCAVEGDEKWDLLRSTDLFVLPSHSENFGLVVAEALACSVPVITTHGTPWEDLRAHECGWWIENRPEILADALRDAMNRTDEERFAMGKRGRELVEKKYSWSKIAEQMKSVYQWRLGKTSKPDCVVLT